MQEPSSEVVEYQPKNPDLNAEGRLNPVAGENYNYTLSWVDGHVGIGYDTAPNVHMPKEAVRKMNQELKGVPGLYYILIYIYIYVMD